MTKKTDSTRAAEGHFKNAPPWHLVDLYWDFVDDAPFESLSVDVVMADDIPDETRLYVSPLSIDLGGQPLYCGFQSSTRAWRSPDAPDDWVDFGRGALFSRWDCAGNPRDYLKMEPGGGCELGDYEGRFCSVRKPLAWTTGRYHCELRVTERHADHLWVGFFLNNARIGQLRFDGNHLRADRNSICSFVEIYGDDVPIASVPEARITFENLRVNGKPAVVKRNLAVYPDDAPSLAESEKSESGSIQITIGPGELDRVDEEEL
jgi:hypothetical protein